MYMKKLMRQVVCTYNDPVVDTKQGKLRGLKIDSTYIFRGVKYANAKRFHMPTEVESWTGTREAIQFGHVCAELNTPMPHDEYTVPHFFYPQSEDCQYLNVWTQSLDRSAKKPVMLWLHGGGWFSGSSLEIYSYDGENLSAFGDVVVVSLNHRLNVLGYLDLSAYGEQYANSANAGLGDLVAALKWINENIEGFGGDPGNVTIFGQSGGGGKVVTLLQTPSADGLFHRAVSQSGGASGSDRPDDAEAKKGRVDFAELVARNLGLDRSNIQKIENVDWYDLAQATGEAIWTTVHERGGRVGFSPLADGKYYMGHPCAVGFREQTKHIPILVGSVLGEFSGNYDCPVGEGSKNWWSDEYKQQLFRERFGDNTDAVMAEFKKAYPDRNTADVLFLDHSMRPGTVAFSKLRASQQGAAPNWNWMFNLESPFYSGTTPWHNAEEPYVFHNADYIESAYIPDVSEKLQDIVAGAWVNFARTGDPNKGGMAAEMPFWPASGAASVPTMCFDRTCDVRTDYDAKLVTMLPNVARGVFPGSGKMVAIFGIEPAK